MSYRFTYAEALAKGWISPEEAKSMQGGFLSRRPADPLPARLSPEVKRENSLRKPRKSDVEGQEQMTLISWFRSTFPEQANLLIHIPNGGYRKNAFEG